MTHGRLNLSTTTPPTVNPPSLTEDDWMESIDHWCFEHLPQGCFQGEHYYEKAKLQDWHHPILTELGAKWNKLTQIYAWEHGLRLKFKFGRQSESELDIVISEGEQVIHICSPYTQGNRRSGYSLKNSLSRV